MSRHDTPDNEIDGQISIEQLFTPPERLIAVSKVFARARKNMSLTEQKSFVFALSQMNFTEDPKTNFVKLDKKTLARIVGVNSDQDHLSVDLFDNIKDMTAHSYIEIREKDLDLYACGFLITSVVSFKNIVRIRFNEDYLPLFTNLTTDYITMWSSDIFQMTSKRSVQFYEYLRLITDTRLEVNDVLLGVKAIKEMFDIPKEGTGSYTNSNGHFDRTNFERYVIDPLCDDLKNSRMIQLILQPNGKYYEKVKRGNRIMGYRFYWTYSAHPAVASASQVHEVQQRVDEDPQILKVATDIVQGEKKGSRNKKQAEVHNFKEREYDYDKLMQQIRDL